MSDDEFDNIPDDFADLQGVNWAEILGGPSTTHAPNTRSPNSELHLPLQDTAIPSNIRAPLSDSSSYFSDDDGMDSGFLAELDRLEETLTHGQAVASSYQGGAPAANINANAPSSSFDEAVPPQPQIHLISMERQNSNRPSIQDGAPEPPSYQDTKIHRKEDAEHSVTIPSKRPRSEDLALAFPRSKGKMKADDDKLQQILSRYEDELICPICCDLFVESHACNPCGHTFCGDCGWQWYNNNAANKFCSCCRVTLDPKNPMIPNISINNTVERHVKALALSGQQEWEPGGRKHNEWMARKQAWRDGATKREKERRRQEYMQPISLGTLGLLDPPVHWSYVPDDSEEDPTYEDNSIEIMHPRPIHRPRRRRQRGGG